MIPRPSNLFPISRIITIALNLFFKKNKKNRGETMQESSLCDTRSNAGRPPTTHTFLRRYFG